MSALRVLAGLGCAVLSGCVLLVPGLGGGDCGDGIVQTAEACDDGNTSPGDGCDALCQPEGLCGDGILSAGEACDPPDGITCDEQCQLLIDPNCGNEAIDPGEVCDDGNNAAGDGCRADCQGAEVCGDGLVDPANGEACDDGNASREDGCSRECQVEGCGDGLVQAGLGEECDDGNTLDGDGCDALCAVEVVPESEPNDDGTISSGFAANGNDFSADNAQGPFSSSVLIAGSLFPEGDEDGYLIDVDLETEVNARILSANGKDNCAFGGPTLVLRNNNGNVIASDGSLFECPSLDFVITANQRRFVNVVGAFDSEELDSYELALVFIPVICGDGIEAGNEECDDGNNTNGDGCDNDCERSCGNGFLNGGEECDDGNGVGGDGCSSGCGVEPGFVCVDQPSVCFTACGDGVVAGGEECDDGNTDPGDGCDAGCFLE